jgi:FkbM family methyltransferase
MSLNLRDEIDAEIFVLREYDPATTAVLQAALRPADVFLDVGANIGYFSLLAWSAVGTAGRVIAFEPNPATRRRLTINLALNHAGETQVEPCALSHKSGIAILVQEVDGRSGDAFVRDVDPTAGDPATDTVVQRQLDEFLDYGRPGQTLLKIDTEGHEVRILGGGLRFLRTHSPLVVIEVNRAALSRAGNTPDELADILKAAGYSPYVVEDREGFGECSWDDIRKIVNGNMVAAIPGKHDAHLGAIAADLHRLGHRFAGEIRGSTSPSARPQDPE